jgi:hypothetical protein
VSLVSDAEKVSVYNGSEEAVSELGYVCDLLMLWEAWVQYQ